MTNNLIQNIYGKIKSAVQGFSYPNIILDKYRFLYIDQGISTTFLGTDSEELFKKNLTSQPDSWLYRTQSVKYTCNSMDYRTVEFKDIDWASSVVLFGCSNVFGIGLDDSQTISSHLSNMINCPIINMGIGGSSIDFSLYNSVILNAGYPTPKGIVHIWSSPNRAGYYHSQKVEQFGNWSYELASKNNTDIANRMKWVLDDVHCSTHAVFASMISKQLWLEKTKYYEASFFQNTSQAMRCDYLRMLDFARDLGHPGEKTAIAVAELIATKLNI